MNEQELKEFIESRGYEFLGIRQWKNGSFTVRAQTSKFRLTWHYKIPLTQIPSKFDGSKLWIAFSKDWEAWRE